MEYMTPGPWVEYRARYTRCIDVELVFFQKGSYVQIQNLLRGTRPMIGQAANGECSYRLCYYQELCLQKKSTFNMLGGGDSILV